MHESYGFFFGKVLARFFGWRRSKPRKCVRGGGTAPLCVEPWKSDAC